MADCSNFTDPIRQFLVFSEASRPGRQTYPRFDTLFTHPTIRKHQFKIVIFNNSKLWKSEVKNLKNYYFVRQIAQISPTRFGSFEFFRKLQDLDGNCGLDSIHYSLTKTFKKQQLKIVIFQCNFKFESMQCPDCVNSINRFQTVLDGEARELGIELCKSRNTFQTSKFSNKKEYRRSKYKRMRKDYFKVEVYFHVFGIILTYFKESTEDLFCDQSALIISPPTGSTCRTGFLCRIP